MNPGSYVSAWKSGKLSDIHKQLYSHYRHCGLCPRECGANRFEGETGTCRSGTVAKVCSAHAHFGEETPLVGRSGSGTIFFSSCNLLCLYCQNWDISHHGEGSLLTDEALAQLMLSLQKRGCHNINLVTPTHFLPNITGALLLAAENGLRIPLVFNTGGYDKRETIRLLDGIVDIYLPDYKYAEGIYGDKYSMGASDYPLKAEESLKEMFRQAGVLKTDSDGIAVSGLMIRHLVLPNNLAGTERLVKFIAEELDPGTYLNIMAQYRPVFKAHQYSELGRSITPEEFAHAVALAHQHGLTNLD